MIELLKSLFAFICRLLVNRTATPIAPTAPEVLPEAFDFSAGARNSSWSLRWESGQLTYREFLPPLEIYPTPGSKQDETQIAVATSTAQWQALWDAAERAFAWQWRGDYSKVMGGEQWRLVVRKAGKSISCDGNNSLDNVPPQFVPFLQAVVDLAGPSCRSPARLLERIVLREKQDRELKLAEEAVGKFFQIVERGDRDAVAGAVSAAYPQRAAEDPQANWLPALQQSQIWGKTPFLWHLRTKSIPENPTSFEFKGVVNAGAIGTEVGFVLQAEKEPEGGEWRVGYFSIENKN